MLKKRRADRHARARGFHAPHALLWLGQAGIRLGIRDRGSLLRPHLLTSFDRCCADQATNPLQRHEAMSRLGVLQTTRLIAAPCKLKSTPNLLFRSYATPNSQSGPPRRQVTVANDDGRVNWSELSAREKAARTTQQSFNLLIIAVGVVMTVRIQPT